MKTRSVLRNGISKKVFKSSMRHISGLKNDKNFKIIRGYSWSSGGTYAGYQRDHGFHIISKDRKDFCWRAIDFSQKKFWWVVCNISDGLRARSCFQCLLIVILADNKTLANIRRYIRGNLSIPRLRCDNAWLEGVRIPVISNMI